MPEAAKAHTKAGAKAFVEYFWRVVNYAQATGDTDAIAALSDPTCTGCRAGIDSIDHVYQKGGAIEGGRSTISDVRITLGWVKKAAVADVTFEVAVAAQIVRYPSSERTGTKRRSRDRFTLVASPRHTWRVTDFRVAR